MVDEITTIEGCIAPVAHITSQRPDSRTSCVLTMSTETLTANTEPYMSS